jgi:MOSC domain-containing protein YiiM
MNNNKSRLMQRYVKNVAPGKLCWIGLRPQRRAPLLSVNTTMALAGLGLEGDHRCTKTPGSGRQVTVISREFVSQIAYYSGVTELDHALLRRNLLVSGINLNALRHQQFSIGGALFEATMPCHPCSRMESVLGPGGMAAMLGHGGFCARIIEAGPVTVGDSIALYHPQTELVLDA